MIKKKKKFINVIPLSKKARNRFINIMDSFHSCEIEQETKDKLFLVSLNKQYCFWIQREGNEHWKLEKQMTIQYTFFLSLFLILGYFIVTEPYFLRFVDLISKLVQNKIERLYWQVRFDPRNPIVNWMKKREYEKIAKELMEELAQKNKD